MVGGRVCRYKLQDLDQGAHGLRKYSWKHDTGSRGETRKLSGLNRLLVRLFWVELWSVSGCSIVLLVVVVNIWDFAGPCFLL